MPKARRKPEEIEAVRDRILEEALEIIASDGYDNLSMRKLASRLGIAAKTIYNYFPAGKEEIYIMVLTRGFEIMYNAAKDSGKPFSDPSEQFRALCREYVNFGITNKNYYNIMFNLDVPKYADYVGTPLEPVAYEEKITALKIAELGTEVLNRIADTYGSLPEQDIGYLLLRLWSTLHGIVSLYNSRVMQEVSDTAEDDVKRMTDDAIKPFLPETLRSS